jgi:two-component system, NarL family, nitrate/nitrite response regulator NarL
MNIATSTAVLIVDDHPLYRDGVVQMLAHRAPNFRCRVARDGVEALATLRHDVGCDLVIADHHLPGPLDGLALLARMAEIDPTAARVLVSGSDDARLPAQARRQGLMGYLPKALEPDQWVRALAGIVAGAPWFPAVNALPASGLTARQATILERIAVGQTNKVIARDLGVTERTINYHLGETQADAAPLHQGFALA